MKKIFTFWEPKDKIPGYIKLCMKTWEKYLPDYEVELCDYDTIKHYLTDEEYESIDFRKMPLAKQSDAIRCALLSKHGGIWMDADTIITSGGAMKELQQGNCCMLNNGKPHTLFGAYIYAAQPNTIFMNKWLTELRPRIAAYKRAYKFRMFRFLFKRKWKQMKNWDYCVNAIIDPLSAEMLPTELVELNGEMLKVIPERLCVRPGESNKEAYIRFWFEESGDYDDSAIGSLIFLHNSWTPSRYMVMTEDDFIKQDIPLAKLLNNVLS